MRYKPAGATALNIWVSGLLVGFIIHVDYVVVSYSMDTRLSNSSDSRVCSCACTSTGRSFPNLRDPNHLLQLVHAGLLKSKSRSLRGAPPVVRTSSSSSLISRLLVT